MIKKILKTNEKKIFFFGFLSNNSRKIRICAQKNVITSILGRKINFKILTLNTDIPKAHH